MRIRQIGRRDLVGGLAALAGAGLTKLTSPGRTEAAANVSVVGPSTAVYGIAAMPGTATAPALPTLVETYGVIGNTFEGANSAHPDNVDYGVLALADQSRALGAFSNTGEAIYGQSGTRTAITGNSASSNGIVGFSGGNLTYGLAGSGFNQAHGLVGYSDNQFGIAGINQNGNNWAGAFFNAQANAPNSGRRGLFVQGDFLVLNGTKSAGVKTDKHGHRKLYAVEATENVFEDFGTAALKGGRARVELDEIFAETVNTGQKYQVFPVPKSAESKGLAVVSQDAKGFTIQELGGGTGSYEVDYRIVAKVKGQEGKRLEQFDPPAVPTPPTPSASGDKDKKDKPER